MPDNDRLKARILRDVQRAPNGQPDLLDIARRHGKRVGRARVIQVVVLAAVLLGVAVPIGLLLPLANDEKTSGPMGNLSTPEVLPSVTTNGECEFPQMRPAYLPWVPAEEPIPSPSRERFEGYALLSWKAPAGEQEGGVTLWRVTTDPYNTGTTSAVEVQVSIGGVKGLLFRGEGGGPNHADWTIMWENGEDQCNRIALSLDLTGISMEEGRDVILEIARSLTIE